VLGPEAGTALLDLRRQQPQLKIKVLVRRLLEQGTLAAGTFRMPSIYRFLAAHGLDTQSVKRQPQPRPALSGPGPTKAFACALANELWMTDRMFGPSLKLPTGQLIHTRLFALLDDCSRWVPHAQYYETEQLSGFLDCFRQALARRGFPEKLYTDRGKIFTSYHRQVICANLQVRLCHAKPYAAWSRGKIEGWFRTLQQDFQARLVLDPVPDLTELNQRLWPVLVLAEAQDYSASALEEVRLLSCHPRQTQPPFSLILVGDDQLLPRLQMGINAPLLGRLSFCLHLPPWTLEDLQGYLQARLEAASIHTMPFEEPALRLLLQAAHGRPRLVNHLAQRALEAAAAQNLRSVAATHVQSALELMPWLAKL